MKKTACLLSLTLLFQLIISCTRKIYPTNGETIYRTGRNNQGQAVLDRDRSGLRTFKNCQGCHGKHGDRIKYAVLKFSFLSNPEIHETPYTDSLVKRFLDTDIKSNGQKANIGVRWNMTEQDKNDLIRFLKTLQ
ncbi:MAG: c-type cytochrome [Sphingobacteriales bacterium]|nr:c-type cytochrome [Sphingobacteriales bacterium]